MRNDNGTNTRNSIEITKIARKLWKKIDAKCLDNLNEMEKNSQKTQKKK